MQRLIIIETIRQAIAWRSPGIMKHMSAGWKLQGDGPGPPPQPGRVSLSAFSQVYLSPDSELVGIIDV